MLNKIGVFFNRIIQRYTPNPFVITIILTYIIFILGISFANKTLPQMIVYWGDGFWKLNTFTLQMVMILIGGHVVASSNLIDSFLSKIAKKLKSSNQAIIAITLISLISSWINWGFGLIIGAIFCKKIN